MTDTERWRQTQRWRQRHRESEGRMRQRRRDKDRREGKTKRDGAEMVSQTDRGRKTQNETQGEAQRRETQSTKEIAQRGDEGSRRDMETGIKAGQTKVGKTSQKMERNWVRRGGAGALKEESMECRWGGGTGPQPCRGKRRGEEPSQGLYSRFWGWARAQAGDTERDGPITVRMPLA